MNDTASIAGGNAVIEIGNCGNDELIRQVAEIRRFFGARSDNSLLSGASDTVPEQTTFAEIVHLQDEAAASEHKEAKTIGSYLYNLGVIGWHVAEFEDKNLELKKAFEVMSSKGFPHAAFTAQLCLLLLSETLESLFRAAAKRDAHFYRSLALARKIVEWTDPKVPNFSGRCEAVANVIRREVDRLSGEDDR